MVAPSSTIQVKRKRVAEMSESPPKRVTRARAKATKGFDSSNRLANTFSAAPKAATESRAPAEFPRATLRKTRAGDVNKFSRNVTLSVQNAESEVQSCQEKPKNDAHEKCEDSLENALIEVRNKTKPETTSSNATNSEMPKPRGRPRKKVKSDEDEPVVAGDKRNAPGPTRMVTRGRAATMISQAPRPKGPKEGVARKKVTFEEDQDRDKENHPSAHEKSDAAAAKATGLKAKPVRRPATTKASTRGNQSRVSKSNVVSAMGPLPLSPMKVKQIAKTNSASSEDELCGEKTVVRAPSISPSKVTPGTEKNTTKLGWIGDCSKVSASTLASPARRPQLSLFKNALKESPKRINFQEQSNSSENSRSICAVAQSPARASFQDSPKRLNPGNASRHSALVAPLSLTKSSLLQVSPRRVNLGRSQEQQPANLIQSPLKSCRLQSPARRLPLSPIVAPASSLTSRWTTTAPIVEAADRGTEGNSFKTPCLSSKTGFGNSAQVAESPEVQISAVDQPPSADLQYASPPHTTTGDVPISSSSARPSDELLVIPRPLELSKLNRHEISDPSNMELAFLDSESAASAQKTTQPGAPPSSDGKLSSLLYRSFQDAAEESDSDDELSSPQKSHVLNDMRNKDIFSRDVRASACPIPSTGCSHADHQQHMRTLSPTSTSSHTVIEKAGSLMTPLALQLSSWSASSPEKTSFKPYPDKSGSADSLWPLCETNELFPQSSQQPAYFEDEMAVYEQGNEALQSETPQDGKKDFSDFPASQESQASEVYGDENVAPVDPMIKHMRNSQDDHTSTCTPAKAYSQDTREICTISRVPLRAAAEDSPPKASRKRSRSLSESSGRVSPKSSTDCITNMSESLNWSKGNLTIPRSNTFQSPGNMMWPSTTSPMKPVRIGADSEVLKGAVVFVDVHTTEGADASPMFVELLTQMGAKCVKHWSWNPKPSSGLSPDNDVSASYVAQDPSPPEGKTGITHVVFKDGGKRTLEKVRISQGVVICVGVGWVLDCESQNRWLDEAHYAVDTLMIPRGGHRRRKSMEPRMLSNINGSITDTQSSAGRSIEMSPTKEFLILSPQSPHSDSVSVTPKSIPAMLATPIRDELTNEEKHDSELGSPTTPYYLSQGAKLVQQTCPPKQTQQPLFPLSGRIEDQENENVRRRLVLARRKSLQWAARVASPLGRTVHGPCD